MTLNGHSKNKKMSPKICETRCRKPVDLVVFIKTKYFICYANLKDVGFAIRDYNKNINSQNPQKSGFFSFQNFQNFYLFLPQ